ncbi:MAG: hypothetical protein AB7V40_01330 [Methyloceanibacter sp.]
MIVEFVTLLTLLIVGAAFMQGLGLASWVSTTFYLMIGMSIYVVIAFIQSLIAILLGKYAGILAIPQITLAICLILSFLYIIASYRETFTWNFLAPIVAMSLVYMVIIVFLWNIDLVKYHKDSIFYLINGALLEGGNLSLVGVKRFTSIALLHAPANIFTSNFYLRALEPAIGLATLGALFWFTRIGLDHSLPRKEALLFAIAGALLLLTTNRFVWHAFYINAHLMTAGFMLIAAGSGWLIALEPSRYKQFLCLQGAGTVGLILSREEGPLMAALVLLPTLLFERIPWRWRAGALLLLGFTVLLQQGFIIARAWPVLRHSALELMVFGVLAILSCPLLSLRWLDRYSKHALLAAEAVLWIALVVYALRHPGLLDRSVNATLANTVFGAGGWGASLVILTLLVVVVIVFTSAPHRIFLRFPVTTFLPLAFLLAYLRHEPYRVGVTDSLSRMLIHIVPLAILFVVSAAASKGWALRSGRGEPRQSRVPPALS